MREILQSVSLSETASRVFACADELRFALEVASRLPLVDIAYFSIKGKVRCPRGKERTQLCKNYK